ncbi:Phosphoesterase domain [Macleaya cordata]|uniref:Phosphoesterase domain n=1 Tax=Macleaya cordata TaxID=56857 RepID=A0A200Q5Y9_MACCD|nr:Phosphoesterase domain [Macleaya cordata]
MLLAQLTRGGAYLGDQVKIAVLADPQLMDHTSLPLAPKSLALEIAQFYTDLYMRRSFLASILPFKPDLVLFLGDFFDGGPQLSDEEWQESLSRFRHIFDLNHRGRYSDIPVYNIPGNHDNGYAAVLSHNPKVIDRYEKEFGARDYRFTVGEVEFIAIDSQTLDGLEHGTLTSTTWNFVKNVSADVMVHPRVLLTHIPLYRPDWTSCGPQRSSPIINQRVSRASYDQDITYQNYLTEESSRLLLDLIRPVLVLSGHDHDQCTVTHLTQHGPIKEHTLGTLSWQQGNLYPSFMLLTASKNLTSSNTTKPEDAVSTQLCFLPMQLHIYIWYLSLFVLTVLVLLLWPTNGLGAWNHYIHSVGSMGRALLSSDIFKGRSKEKDEEDESCEYEMVWDAEGSMHLVKKMSTKATFTSSTESELVARGNAVLRPVSKKHISQDPMEASVSVEMNTEDGGNTVVLHNRSSRSKTKMVCGRLVRTLRLLVAIAVVNLPLYMMFLANDWIN